MTEENRTGKVSVMLTPAVLRKLDAYAAEHRWSRSTAAAVLIEKGLAADQRGKEARSDGA